MLTRTSPTTSLCLGIHKSHKYITKLVFSYILGGSIVPELVIQALASEPWQT
jgi:hypothetical protein